MKYVATSKHIPGAKRYLPLIKLESRLYPTILTVIIVQANVHTHMKGSV